MLNLKMIQVMKEVGQEVAERGSLIEKIAVALLTRKNLFILGDTGQAKSEVINLFRKRITGACQFERLMSKGTDEEQLFGRLDLASLIPGNVARSVLEQDSVYLHLLERLKAANEDYAADPDADGKWRQIDELTEQLTARRHTLAELCGGTPEVITAGKIPQSHIVFLDEIFKSNEGVLNSLLTALNERRYTNEGYTVDIPVISFFAASNEIPNFSDPAERILRPLYDRFDLKVVTKYVEEKEARMDILAQKQRPSTGAGAVATISLDDLYNMQAEVRAVSVPDSINELMDNILCELRKKGIHVSDRKFFNYAPLVQARAWLSSRDHVIPADLGILNAYFWTTPEEIEKIDSVIRELVENPLGDRIREIHGMAAEAFDDYKSVSAGNRGRAMAKFRGDFIALYRQILLLQQDAQSQRDTDAVQVLLDDLEDMSRQAHSSSGFTYTTLPELAALAA